jgi:hypothetical protein
VKSLADSHLGEKLWDVYGTKNKEDERKSVETTYGDAPRFYLNQWNYLLE